MPVERLRFDADPMAVRHALIQVEGGVTLASLAEDCRSDVLLVLAEVMNNIAEHAYGGGQGRALLSIWHEGGALVARIIDRGVPAPPIPADAVMADPSGLPEGGFGYPLIRLIAREVTQSRRLGCNILRITVQGDISP